jgi:hypothetical protein
MPKVGLFVFSCWVTLIVCASSFAQEIETRQPSLIVVIESHSQSVSASELRATISSLLGIPVAPLSSAPVAQIDSIVCIYLNPERELSVLFHDPKGTDQSFTFTPQSYGNDNTVSIANIVVSLVRSYGITEPVRTDTLERPDMRFNPYFEPRDSPEQYRPSYSLPPMNPYYYAPGVRRNRT